MRFYSVLSSVLFGVLLSVNASAQTATPYWEAIADGGMYGDPVQACYQSYRAFSANDGLEPNDFDVADKTAVCRWDKGSPGYWGTTGHAQLKCPGGKELSDDGNYCKELTGEGDCATGNPIKILDGSKFLSETDFTVGRGRLHFTRTYNSFAFNDDNYMGRRWASNFHPHVKGSHHWYYGHFTLFEPNGDVIRFGRIDPFAGGRWGMMGLPWDGNAGWFGGENHDRKDKLGYTLTEEPGGLKLTLRNPDGMERDFEYTGLAMADGILTEIRYPDGYTIDFTYNADRVLQSVTDTDGYTISFSYNARGLLDTTTAPDGTEYKYEYTELPSTSWTAGSTADFGNLWLQGSIMSAAMYPDDTPSDDTDNPRRQYNYDDPDFELGLTSLVDERGITIREWAYQWSADSGHRAISSVGPMGRELTTVTEVTHGSQIRVTNALGKEAVFNFSNQGKVPKLTSIDGAAGVGCAASTDSVGYDGYGNVTFRTGAEGQVTNFTVDTATGLPSSVTEAAGSSVQEVSNITWDSTLRKPTVIDAPDLRTEFTYDADWNVTQQKLIDATSHTAPYSTNGQTRTWDYTWNADGLLASIDGPLAGAGDTLSFTYDTSGNLASVTDEVGHTTTINNVDGMGRPTQITDPNSVVTNISYTPRGWVEQVSVDDGSGARVPDLSYDDAGNLTRIDFPNGGWLTYTYDDSAWLTAGASSTGDSLSNQHDLLGNVTRVDMQGGSASAYFTMQYDGLSRLTQLLGGAGDVRNFSYDRSDRQTGIVDGTGRSWLTAFDALNRAISETDPEGHSVAYDWGPTDALETFTDGRALATVFVRNGFGEVIRETSPDRGVTDYWYDVAGRMTRMLDAEGDDVTYAYDDAGRLTSEAYPNQAALNATYTYDSTAGGNQGVGMLTGASNAASGHAFTYNGHGELTSQESSVGAQTYNVGQTFNAAGQMTKLILPSGREVDYTYDGLDRITSIYTKPNGGGSSQSVVSNVGYSSFGPITGYTFGNGATATFGLDASFRLSSLTVAGSGPSLLSKSYSYDNNNRVTWITDNLNSANTASYVYTHDGRLENAVGPWGDYSWSFDAVGNRLTDTRYNGGALTLDDDYTYSTSSNRLLSVSDSGGGVQRMISYTTDGNINTDVQTSNPSRDYDYDDDGRLAQVSVSGVVVAAYDYDAFEHRVRRLEGGVETHFVFSTDGRLLGEYEGGTGAVVAEYIWLANRLVGKVDSAGVLSFVQTGHLGQPLLIMDDAGTALWEGETTPFGVFNTVTATIGDPELRFPGQWLEAGSGLYQNWHRDYDPSLGRYIEADPLGIAAGQSVYGYVGQDPLNFTDRFGLEEEFITRPPFIPPAGQPGAVCGHGFLECANVLLRQSQASGDPSRLDKVKFCRSAAMQCVEMCENVYTSPLDFMFDRYEFPFGSGNVTATSRGNDFVQRYNMVGSNVPRNDLE